MSLWSWAQPWWNRKGLSPNCFHQDGSSELSNMSLALTGRNTWSQQFWRVSTHIMSKWLQTFLSGLQFPWSGFYKLLPTPVANIGHWVEIYSPKGHHRRHKNTCCGWKVGSWTAARKGPLRFVIYICTYTHGQMLIDWLLLDVSKDFFPC